MWKHPDLNFVLSGYGDIYTTEELDRNIDLVRVNPEWDETVDSIDPDLIILRADSPLTYALEQSADWSVIRSADGVTVLRPSHLPQPAAQALPHLSIAPLHAPEPTDP